MPYIKCPVCQKDIHDSSSICPFCNTSLNAGHSGSQYYNSTTDYSRSSYFTGFHPAPKNNSMDQYLITPEEPSHTVSGVHKETAAAVSPSSDTLTDKAADTYSGLVMPRTSSETENPLFSSSSEDILLSIRERSRKQAESASSVQQNHDAASHLKQEGSEHSQSTGYQKVQHASAAEAPSKIIPATDPFIVPSDLARRIRKPAPPGRRLWGYRAGNPLFMFLAVSYYLAVCLIILQGIQMFPQYQAAGTLFYHKSRVITGGLMMMLPAILLSETPLRRHLPMFRTMSRTTPIVGLIILYIPLTAIFLLSWYGCQ